MAKNKLNKLIDAWNLIVIAQNKISIQLSGCGLSLKDQTKISDEQRAAFEALTKLENKLNELITKEREK